MSDSDWEVRTAYDYRFGALGLQIRYKDQQSPPFTISIREVLKSIPEHEAKACFNMSRDETLTPDGDIEIHRRRAIENTNLEGKVVLDIGGYGGEFAKMALDKGAVRAIVLDSEQWRHYGWPEIRLPGVEYIKGDYMDYWTGNPETELWPRPDTIIYYNVLYHVKNPWASLEKLRWIINPQGELLLCTLFRYHDGPWWYLYEPRECNPTDESVFWGPSLSGLERLLTQTGWTFKQEGLSYDRVIYRCFPNGEVHQRQSEH